MSQPNEILDGTPPHGTTPLTINAVTYIVNTQSIKCTYASDENHTSTGLPNQKLWVKGRYMFEAELQLATGSTAYPPGGTTFTYTPPNESSPVTFVVIPEDIFDATNDVKIRTAKLKAEQVIIGITTA